MIPNTVVPTPGSSSLPDGGEVPEEVSRLTSWRDWEAIARKERAREMQQLVSDIFREELMGGLAIILIPVLLLFDFGNLSPLAFSILNLIDIAIWVFFVLEYICRLLVAPDRAAFIRAPWNILDLIIVGVPAIALVVGIGIGIARYLRVLRVMQAVQVLKIGAKKAKQHIDRRSTRAGVNEHHPPMQVRSLPITPNPAGSPGPSQPPAWSGADLRDASGKIRHEGLWIDFCGYTEAEISTLAALTGVPLYVLQVKLRERAFPRAEMDGSSMTVFLQVPSLSEIKREYNTWEIQWKGLLVGYDRDGVMTFSQTRLSILDEVATVAPAEGVALTGPGVLYLVITNAMNAIEDLILSAEEQLLYLEVQPINRLPQNFLSMMYADQKEIGRINAGLLHTKTALEVVYKSDPAVFGMTDVEAGRLRALADRCSLLSDSSQHLSDSFAWMVDFYLNTNSFSMNQVMKILAVLTALTMVPAVVGGLLGMNLIGNPWPATLLQVVAAVAFVMVLTAWLYYNLGWLKR